MYFGIYINHTSKYSIYINQVNMVFICILGIYMARKCSGNDFHKNGW